MFIGCDRKGGARRSARAMLRRATPVFLAVALLASFQTVSAAAQIESGSTEQLGNSFAYGISNYMISYTYPSTAQVGTNLTIGATLHVVQLSGLIQYINSVELVVQLYVGSQVLTSTIYGPTGFNVSSSFYAGATWGPNNATFQLTQANTGLAKGQSDNATFSVTLIDSIYYISNFLNGEPDIAFQTEPAMTGQGGSLLIQNSAVTTTTSSSAAGGGVGQSILPYALLASGAVLMVAAVLVPRGHRPPQMGQG